MFRSLSVRLSLTYAACCLFTMTAVLFVSYIFLESSLRHHTDAELASEVPEYTALLRSQDFLVLQDALRQEALSEGIDRVFFRILDLQGNVVFSTDTSSWKALPLELEAMKRAHDGEFLYSDFLTADGEFPARLLLARLDGQLVFQLGESLAENQAILRQFREVFTLATLAFVICSIAAGFYMARRALAGVQRIALAADRIAGGAWDHRVPVSRHGDEIDDLAMAFNAMVDRIQALFRELRDVTDDIAHDLRTPLMRIRGEAEMALREAESDAEGQEGYASVLEECDQMLQLINTMLEISQTEAGAKPIARAPVDLAAAAEDVCELFRPVAEDKQLRLTCGGETAVMVQGDLARIKRALAHLVDNAIKYTPASGSVTVECRTEADTALIRVGDTGVGIPEAQQDEVFSRFYRVETSRSEPGNGLGLSLARAIVRAHGGDIHLQSAAGSGATFTVRLPRSTVK